MIGNEVADGVDATGSSVGIPRSSIGITVTNGLDVLSSILRKFLETGSSLIPSLLSSISIICAGFMFVGVFDSGIGGLTVAHALKEQMPNESIIYF